MGGCDIVVAVTKLAVTIVFESLLLRSCDVVGRRKGGYQRSQGQRAGCDFRCAGGSGSRQRHSAQHQREDLSGSRSRGNDDGESGKRVESRCKHSTGRDCEREKRRIYEKLPTAESGRAKTTSRLGWATSRVDESVAARGSRKSSGDGGGGFIRSEKQPWRRGKGCLVRGSCAGRRFFFWGGGGLLLGSPTPYS